MNSESMDYNYMQKMSELKIGDEVKVLRKAKTGEDGWGTFWVSDMDIYVGKIYKIKHIDDFVGIQLGTNWWFPYFILEKQNTIKLPDHLFTM